MLHYYITTSANLDLYDLSPAAGVQIKTGSAEDGWTDTPSVNIRVLVIKLPAELPLFRNCEGHFHPLELTFLVIYRHRITSKQEVWKVVIK